MAHAFESSDKTVSHELLAQGRPIDAEHRRGPALVASRMREGRFEQGGLHLGHHELEESRRVMSVQIAKVFLHRLPDAGTQRFRRAGTVDMLRASVRPAPRRRVRCAHAASLIR